MIGRKWRQEVRACLTRVFGHALTCAGIMVAVVIGATMSTARSHAGIIYQHDDGQAEDVTGVSGGPTPYSIIWLNLFSAQPGGEVITKISASFARAFDPLLASYNGRTVTALLYEDANGGPTTDAVLRATATGTIQNAGLIPSAFVDFDIPPTMVTGSFLVGVLARDLPQGNYVAAADTTSPTPGVSFIGFLVGTPLNENNLASLGANYRGVEGFGLTQNWLVRAVGNPVPEPGSLGVLAIGFCAIGWIRRRATRA